jgi:hypothetical protein
VEVTRIYHTTKTACEYLAVTPDKLKHRIKQHKIKKVSKVNSNRRFTVEEIERLKECLS